MNKNINNLQVKASNLILKFFNNIENDSNYIIDNNNLDKTKLKVDMILYLIFYLNKKGKVK